jgi:hypothetical protein
MCTLELRNKTSPLPLHGCAPLFSSLQLLWRAFCLKAASTTQIKECSLQNSSHAVFSAPSLSTLENNVGRVHGCLCTPPPNYKGSFFPVWSGCTHSSCFCPKTTMATTILWCSWREFPKARPCTFMVSLLPFLLPTAPGHVRSFLMRKVQYWSFMDLRRSVSAQIHLRTEHDCYERRNHMSSWGVFGMWVYKHTGTSCLPFSAITVEFTYYPDFRGVHACEKWFFALSNQKCSEWLPMVRELSLSKLEVHGVMVSPWTKTSESISSMFMVERAWEHTSSGTCTWLGIYKRAYCFLASFFLQCRNGY